MSTSFLKNKTSLLKSRPLVVGTLNGASALPAQLRLARSARIDIVELRLDTFSKSGGPFQRVQEFGRNLISEIKSKTKLPVLLTLRSPDESGRRNGTHSSDARRAEILARLLPSVEMVDVEIKRPDFARRMTVIGHIHHVDVIHSAHDFSGPGNLAALAKLGLLSQKLKGDVFKVAVTPRDNDGLEKFLRWGLALPMERKILIGMGQSGLFSRVAAFSFGSALTYGHLGRSAAPGQMPAGILARTIREVYGAH